MLCSKPTAERYKCANTFRQVSLIGWLKPRPPRSWRGARSSVATGERLASALRLNLMALCCRLLVQSARDLRAEGSAYDELLAYVRGGGGGGSSGRDGAAPTDCPFVCRRHGDAPPHAGGSAAEKIRQVSV